jgi:hypothetical protein
MSTASNEPRTIRLAGLPGLYVEIVKPNGDITYRSVDAMKKSLVQLEREFMARIRNR